MVGVMAVEGELSYLRIRPDLLKLSLSRVYCVIT